MEKKEKNEKKKIFIGVAWPYANGPLHLGHVAGSLLPPDIFARYNRMVGNEVLMISGSDEHGTPITITAEKKKVSPKEIVDRYHREHVESLRKLGIKFDLFTRTTTDNHRKVVQEMFKKLYENGYIYKRKMTSPYCQKCDRYLPDRYVEGKCPFCGGMARGDQCDSCGEAFEPMELIDAKCAICGESPIYKETEQFVFALSKFQESLSNWLGKKEWKASVKKFVDGWLKEGLRDRVITRDLKWGVPIPFNGFDDKCIYVWFDAVTGYLSASKEWAMKMGDENKWEEWWKDAEVEHYYFLAKDNIPFHAIIWPAMLMGYGGLNLPTAIPANEYLTLSGEQFSKSKGIGIWVNEVLEKFDPDAVRYYLSMNMPEKRDTDWKWEDFEAKNNDELVGNYGNFIHRVLSFSYKKFGKIPELKKMDDDAKKALEKINAVTKETGELIQLCKFKEGIKEVMSLAHYGNKYINKMEPWKLVNCDREKCSSVMHIACRMVKALAILTAPFLPFSADRLWSMLGYNGSVHDQKWDETLKDIKSKEIEEPKPLFEKIDLKVMMVDPFSKIDLKIAKILDVRDHPSADKLYVLDIEVGLEKREIVAGIKKYYEKEELIDKSIVVVANLKPATIRSVESQGMLLAAEDDKGISILIADGDPGDPVFVEGIKGEPDKVLELDEFEKIEMFVGKKGEILYKRKALKTEKGNARVDRKVREGSRIS